MTHANGRHSTKSTKAVDRRKNEYKKLLKEAVTTDDFLKLLDVLKTKAYEGDIKAIQLLLEHTVGRPTQNIEIDQEQEEGINEITIHIIKNDDTQN